MMTNLSTGDTVKPTNSNNSTIHGECSAIVNKRDPGLRATRKRRRLELSSTSTTDIPQKTQRRNEQDYGDENVLPVVSCSSVRDEGKNRGETRKSKQSNVLCDADTRQNRSRNKRLSETSDEREWQEKQIENDTWMAIPKRKKQELVQHLDASTQDTVRKPVLTTSNGRDESTKLRKTIQWLEEGARRLREDLANARSELHEEKRAAKIAKREVEAAIREARAAEAAKYQIIISELKNRLSRGGSAESNCTSPSPSSSPFRADFMKDENHKREVSAMKKRLAESEKTIRKLKWETLSSQTKTVCRADGTSCIEVRRLETEIHSLRAYNEKLEAKLRIAIEAEKARTTELRIQHENHEAELSALRKSLRSETIKMMDELRGKNREIEKLSKLLQTDNSRKRRKSAKKDDTLMHKLQDGEKNGPIRSNSRMEKKFLADDHTLESYIRDAGCDKAIAEVEVERLRELALEQQEVIEILRQTVKEKERKLEQLSNKRRKEEFYRQWLELEPVAEVDDEEDHEEGDSALSSAPSSLSPQPGGCGQWQGSGVTREAYEAVLIEIEELQSKLLDERQELSRAKAEVRDLEKALLQETRCGSRNKQVDEFNDKLRAAEEREANLLAELSELREQNELLEFRLLELEESPARRDSPDHTADSGIVSPELIHPNKDRTSKQRNRAVATVIPYTNNNNFATTRAVSPVPRKPPLSLQESGIFEEEAEEEEELDEEEEEEEETEVALTTCGTQTEVPSGELLQEVQRLQELRARIQERAAKVTNPGICSIDPARICLSIDSNAADVSVDSIVQLSSYQERIRELEEKITIYEEAEEKRAQDRRLSKQREEELLDENYRLAERVYWLENKLQNLEELVENRSASRNGYASNVSEEEEEKRKMDDDFARLEGEKARDFQSVDVGVSTAEMRGNNGDFGGKVNGGENCSKAVQVAEKELLDDSIEHCPRCKTRNRTNSEDETDRWTIARAREVMVEDIQNSAETVDELVKEAKEGEEENGTDEVDTGRRSNCGETSEGRRISQVLVRMEEDNVSRDESTEQIVPFNESESEKKVIYFRWR